MKSPDTLFRIEIDGKTIPANKFTITGGSYGSVGHCEITTSNATLRREKIDLFDLTSKKPGFTEVDITVEVLKEQPKGYNVTPPQPSQGTERTKTRIFGGEYLSTTWNMDADSVVIKARDWAGQLLDQKRVLTKVAHAIESLLKPLAPGRVTAAGVSGENQKIGDIVTAIATEFGFTPVLNLSDSKGNPTAGTLYGSGDQTFIQVPQSLWNILNQIARDTGYTVYVTPKKELVFGEPGVGLDEILLSFGRMRLEKGHVPCKNLLLEHHPRRNSTFRVLVMSYNPATAQTVVGRANYIGDNYAGQNKLTSGIAAGNDAIAADKAIAKLDVSVKQVALYSFHIDGLSQEQADLRAATIATDIAKREVILQGSIDGLAKILPTQIVKIFGSDITKQMTEEVFHVSQYTQSFTLPTGQVDRGDAGWMTSLTALNVPEESQASSRSQSGGTRNVGSGGSKLQTPKTKVSDFGSKTAFPTKVG